LVKNNRINRN